MADKYNLPVEYDKVPPRERRLVREQYIKQQGGACMFCKRQLTETPPKSVTSKKVNWDLFPPFFLKHPIHLQHCHDSGLTEGAVHALCNAVMWQFHGR